MMSSSTLFGMDRAAFAQFAELDTVISQASPDSWLDCTSLTPSECRTTAFEQARNGPEHHHPPTVLCGHVSVAVGTPQRWTQDTRAWARCWKILKKSSTRRSRATPDPADSRGGRRLRTRTAPLAISRTILAVAELTALVSSSDHELLPSPRPARREAYVAREPPQSLRLVPGRFIAARHAPAGSSPSLCSWSSSWVPTPRWTCVPHWYVAFSLADSITQPDGGDAVAAIATMLFIPMLLGDDRVWQWSRPAGPLAPFARGSAHAAWRRCGARRLPST